MKKLRNSPSAGRRKLLRSKKGFTLAEMLISVLLLGFVSVMVAVISSVILDSTVTMREVAQAEVLGSEALDNVQGQLRTAQNVKIVKDGALKDGIIFDIDSANKEYMFGVENGVIVLGKAPKAEGDVFQGDPLFAGVSYGNLVVSDLQLVGNDETDTIEISVAVAYGGKTLWNGSVSVRPLNGVSLSTTTSTSSSS